MPGMAGSCAPPPSAAAAPACSLEEEEENLTHHAWFESLDYIYIYICQEDTSLKKPFLDVNTGSLLLLLCFWVLGGRTLPHGSLSLFLPLSLCFDLLCFFPWLESSRGVVLYMLHWVRLGTMMTFTSCHPFSFLYYLFQTSSNNKYEKSSSKCHYFLISGLT
jgi:hypothetical protein